MAMQDVELVIAHHFVHPHGERQIVWRILEERIASDVHLVKPDPRQEARQAERLLIGDEVHFVATRGERDAKFSRDGARSTVGRIAGDPDLHAVLVCIAWSATDSS